MSPQKIAPKVLSWADDLDEKTTAQVERLSRLPFVQGHVALMPDAHLGMGATIGSVFATKGAVVPAAVGVDIGCGMAAVRLDLTSHDLPDELSGLHARFVRAVPAGVGQGHLDGDAFPDALKRTPGSEPWTSHLYVKATKQFGSLGSGNHFVELSLDEQDRVWLVLHSGSRGVGNLLAQYHIERAQKETERWFVPLEDRDLAYLPAGTPEHDAYIADMLWAQAYALANRERMLKLLLDQVDAFLGADISTSGTVNCHHNFAAMEHHHGQNVLVTRKGAIRARVGDRGIIPGSMGTSTYIVKGKGNPASFDSCSHGAGRRMSRGQAKRTLDVAGLETAMKGKAWNDGDALALLDEDPRAYKDIGHVMALQADLVEVEHKLDAILNMKGT